MNDAFVNLARDVFIAACSVGYSRLPEGTAESFARLRDGGQLPEDWAAVLGTRLVKQFPFLRHRTLVSQHLSEAARSDWEAAVRAVLTHLSSWSPSMDGAVDRLSMLLFTMDALGLDSVDVRHSAFRLENEPLIEALHRFIRDAKVGSWNDRIPTAEQDIQTAAKEENFLKIRYILPHLMPMPNAALSSAVRLLWGLGPERLADAVTANDSVNLALLVRFALKEDFPAFALSIPVVWLKYVSVDDIELAHRRGSNAYDWATLLRELLVQISETSCWSAWMNALLRAPLQGSLICIALAAVLPHLQSTHRASFVAAVDLSHSKGAAEPIAEIMSVFAVDAAASETEEMWSWCYERWNKWDYGRGEQHAYLFAPAVCAFDYPVAMYFSRIPEDELERLEASLQFAVDTIEQQWFDSSTALITERNRLLSRLRLVIHARALAAGKRNHLPPPIEAPDAYTSARYHFRDLEARN